MTVLHLDGSPRGERSVSRKLARELVASLPAGRVIYRDLGRQVIPPVTEEWIAAAYTPEPQRTEDMRALLRFSDELIDELLAADVLVLSTPMYNFGVPSNVKAWIDQVIRVGRTFAMPGFRGLAAGKKAYIVLASGGQYGPGSEHLTPFLRQALAYIGITDVTFLPVATADGEETRMGMEEQARRRFLAAEGITASAA